MTELRSFSMVAVMTVATAMSGVLAADTAPGMPSLSMQFEIDGNVGKVTGRLTAPSKSTDYQELPADTKIDIVVKRSCYALSQSNVVVGSFTGLAPGESVTLTDDADPAWECGYDYTYNTYPSISGVEGTTGYGSCSPGVKFAFDYNSVKALPEETSDGYQVVISAPVPVKTSGYPQTDLPMEMTALEFYRITDFNTYPYATELIGTIQNPAKGDTYSYTDKTPAVNDINRYMVKCVSPFGFAETTVTAYVGLDIPVAPGQVTAEHVEGGNRITWTAATEGINGGIIDPADTRYIVYRVWGASPDQRVQIADDITECEYIDYGTDLETPMSVRYAVQSANSVGLGRENYSGYDYNLTIGPSYRLPYVETFDGGLQKVWTVENSSYYSQLYTGTEAEFGADNRKVAPHSGTGLLYGDYTYNRGDVTNDLTSYDISVAGSGSKGVSFWYYALPSTDISVDLMLSEDGGDFRSLRKVFISRTDDGGSVSDEEWKKVFLPLELKDDTDKVTLKFHFSAPESKQAAIIDDVMLLEYPAVRSLDVEYRSADCEAVLTWEDPSTEFARAIGFEGIVNGESIGEVASPWVYKADDYNSPVTVAVKTLYEGISSFVSPGVQVSVPRPSFTEFTIDSHVFAVVQGTAPDVYEVTVKQYIGDAVLYRVPERVSYDEKSYVVTGIDAGAYKGNSTLSSVTVTGDVARIGDDAFAGCTSMMALSLGANVSAIGARAFMDCEKLTRVIFLCSEVPEIGADAFKGVAPGCRGECPEGTIDAYESEPALDPLDFSGAGIDAVGAEVDAARYYDLQGRRVLSPAHGQTVIEVSAEGSVLRIFR